jgi:hypothetical protein
MVHDASIFPDLERAPYLAEVVASSCKASLCCSFADGFSVQDVDWDAQDGHYRVRIYGQWVVVPDAAVVTEPNRFGPTVVWPCKDNDGTTQIRCFMPGAGT